MIRYILLEYDTRHGEVVEVLDEIRHAFVYIREADDRVRIAEVLITSINGPDATWPHGNVRCRVTERDSRCHGWDLRIDPADLSAILAERKTLLTGVPDAEEQIARIAARYEGGDGAARRVLGLDPHQLDRLDG